MTHSKASTSELTGRIGTDTSRMWNGSPDEALVRQATNLPPGRALDLGCGPGADAIWLGQRGWRVVATDASQEALDQTGRHAAWARVAERIACQHHNPAVSFPDGTFDLVHARLFRLPTGSSGGRVLRAAASAVAHGGVLLVTGRAEHESWDRHAWLHEDWPDHKAVLGALDLPAGFWDVQLLDVHQHSLRWRGGQPITRVDSTLRMMRRHIARPVVARAL
jgi:SAM-dependent methyltransferase